MHMLKVKASEPVGMAKEIEIELAPLSYILQLIFVYSIVHFGKEGVGMTKYCRLNFRIIRQTAKKLQ